MRNNKAEDKALKHEKIETPFHERFDIHFKKEDARKRFINRVNNRIFKYIEDFYPEVEALAKERLADELGKKYLKSFTLYEYVRNDFHNCLQAVEVMYACLIDFFEAMEASEETKNTEVAEFNSKINKIIDMSEIDLGICWENGKFNRKGAKILDEKLVYEPLKWLSKAKYVNVYSPFAKGLSIFLRAEKNPELLTDVITDMYEAVEGMAKIITGRYNKDLSSNVEMFIAKLKVSPNYKILLKDYISYANEFRHSPREMKRRPHITVSEVESFIYLTGLFIRLSTESL
ncbi:MAG: hypothetical protein ACTSRA_22165 [Promethearchaeota archaeon]